MAAGLWIALGFIVWNVVFDYEIRLGADRYLYAQAMHALGRGPRPRIDQTMDAAARRGVKVATLWGGALAAAGLAGVGYAASRSKRAGRG